MRLRDTQARFRKRVRFWGLDAPVFVLVGSAALSGLLALNATRTGNVVGTWFSVVPFGLTFTYYAVFVTGHRPHFREDLFGLLLRGRALSPAPRTAQPKHPCLPRLKRSQRCD